MSYGNSTELWIVGARGGELKYQPSVFPSENAAREWARAHASISTDYAIYSCKLIGLMVVDGPRWVDHRSQPATE